MRMPRYNLYDTYEIVELLRTGSTEVLPIWIKSSRETVAQYKVFDVPSKPVILTYETPDSVPKKTRPKTFYSMVFFQDCKECWISHLLACHFEASEIQFNLMVEVVQKLATNEINKEEFVTKMLEINMDQVNPDGTVIITSHPFFKPSGVNT